MLLSSVCMVSYKDASGNTKERPLVVAPAFSVEVQPSSAVIPSSLRGSTRVKANAHDHGSTSDVQVALRVPAGWRADPKQLPARIVKNQPMDAAFDVFPSELKEGRTEIRAKAGDSR